MGINRSAFARGGIAKHAIASRDNQPQNNVLCCRNLGFRCRLFIRSIPILPLTIWATGCIIEQQFYTGRPPMTGPNRVSAERLAARRASGGKRTNASPARAPLKAMLSAVGRSHSLCPRPGDYPASAGGLRVSPRPLRVAHRASRRIRPVLGYGEATRRSRLHQLVAPRSFAARPLLYPSVELGGHAPAIESPDSGDDTRAWRFYETNPSWTGMSPPATQISQGQPLGDLVEQNPGSPAHTIQNDRRQTSTCHCQAARSSQRGRGLRASGPFVFRRIVRDLPDVDAASTTLPGARTALRWLGVVRDAFHD